MLHFSFIVAVIISCYSCLSFAADPEAITTDTLPEITVVDSAAVTTPGKSVLGRELIQALPQGDGAITDLFKVLPGIQFSEIANSSLTGGEILPAEISIAGGRVYDNNFMIDGLGNNSLLDPTYTNTTHNSLVPGHSQELFFDSSLIDNISVFRSNISARYSGFSGGVVDVDSRDPSKTFSGKISARTTRSEWTSFHIDREEEEDFRSSDDADRQPEFRKYYANVNLDIPLTDNSGVLLSYAKTYSKISLWNFAEEQNQYRELENLFVKYKYTPTDRTTLRLSYLMTPYEGEYFRSEVKDSRYTLEGGGWSIAANLEHQFDVFAVEVIAALKQSNNNRTAPQNYFVYRSTASADWGDKYSKKGGYGDVEKQQDTFSIATHLTFEPFYTKWLRHDLVSGVTVERVKGSEERTDTSSAFSNWSVNDEVTCANGSIDCLAGEQFAIYKTIYPEYAADAELTSLSAYLEDSVSWKRVTLRPGVNLSYNDMTKNMDYAARSAVFYDVFADGATILSAGANRYYGKTLLRDALASERVLYTNWTRSANLEDDGSPQDWLEKKRSSLAATRVADLKTPRVDEWSVAIEQDLWGGRVSLCYIDRNSEDGLTLNTLDKDENDYIYSEWTNLGNGRHQEVTAVWERQWQQHYLLIDATWQDSQSSNENYADNLELEDLSEQVWYNGHPTSLINLPRSDYNREWSANLIYRASLPYGFSFTNITRYRSGYSAIADTRENYDLPDGERMDIYADISYPSSTTFDWKLAWAYAVTQTQILTITADITNVFNRKLYTGTEGEYEMGRQLWVGIDYIF